MMILRHALFAAGLCAGLSILPACGADPDADAGAPRSIVSAAVEPVPGKDWPQWRGPGRDARSADTGLLGDWQSTQPKLAWSTKGMGKSHASVVVADGRVYTTGDTGREQAIVAMDERDGKILWTTPIQGQNRHQGSHATPAVDGDRLYVVASSGAVACLETATGKIVWQRDLQNDWKGNFPGYGYSGSPLVDGEKLICTPGGPDAMLVALDKRTGEETWRAAVPGGGSAEYSSPVVSEGAGVRQYVQLVGRAVVSVRADDGKFLWRYTKVSNGTANIPTCIPTGDYVFCSSGYGTGAALLKLSPAAERGVDAEEVYFLSGNTVQNHHGGMVLVGEHVYLGNGHNNGFPTCVELATGKIAWGGKIRGPGSGSAAVVYADGNLVFRYQSGEVALVGATPDGYELKGTFRPEHVESPSWSHPVVCNGKLFLREQDVLMCYDVSATN